jgi:hypothetical protein
METDIQKKKTLPIASAKAVRTTENDWDVAMEQELRTWEDAERERLGIKAARQQWADNMLTPNFTKKERPKVTLLISGLTAAQDFLCEGALKGVGYNVLYFGMSHNEGLQAGKEFGNRGQCNPTYFTVGSLVKYLIDLRDKEGMSAEDIVKNYVFVTAGACGPCRFGMYVTEYRKALRDAGFDGFRVMLFQQKGGLDQATGEDVGLELNQDFFIAIVKAIVCGDVMNALAYRIRPYEIEAGATNRAMEEAKRIIYKALYEKTNVFAALWRAQGVRGRQGRQAPRTRQDLDHRRVLGHDHRGRRQLPAAEASSRAKAPSATSSSPPRGCSTTSGKTARDTRERRSARHRRR